MQQVQAKRKLPPRLKSSKDRGTNTYTSFLSGRRGDHPDHDVSILLDRMGSVWTHGAPGTALRATLIDSRFDVLTIAQVAHRSGFGNPMSLRRALHDIYGIGPKELRRTRDHSA